MKIEMCDEFYYRVLDKSKDICKELNTSNENILRNNEDLKIYDGEWVKIKVNNFITHHVKPAESIVDVAKKYNITIEKIMEDNNLNSSKLFIGQTLKIFKRLS